MPQDAKSISSARSHPIPATERADVPVGIVVYETRPQHWDPAAERGSRGWETKVSPQAIEGSQPQRKFFNFSVPTTHRVGIPLHARAILAIIHRTFFLQNNPLLLVSP